MIKKIYIILIAIALFSSVNAGTITNHKISVKIDPEKHALAAVIRLR